MRKQVKKLIADIENDLKICKTKGCKGCESLTMIKERLEKDLIETKKVKFEIPADVVTSNSSYSCRTGIFSNMITIQFNSLSQLQKQELFEAKTLKQIFKILSK